MKISTCFFLVFFFFFMWLLENLKKYMWPTSHICEARAVLDGRNSGRDSFEED